MIIILGAQDYTWSGSGNCGDNLIDESCKSLIGSVSGCGSLIIPYSRIDYSSIKLLNSASAIFIPVFTFWNRLRRENPIFSILHKIKTPLTPLSINTIYRPKSECLDSIFDYHIESDALACLRDVHSSMDSYYCRDQGTARVLNFNKVFNTDVVGGFGWYDKNFMGRPMHVPRSIRRIVFTIGHYRTDYSAQILSLNVLRSQEVF